MRIRLLSAALAASLACSLGVRLAHADIYTWVDASGRVNISNLLPPEGARVTSVTHERVQDPAAREEAGREAARQAELQALTDRVRQLETEIQAALRPVAPPQVVYVPVPVPAPAPVQYQAEMAPPAGDGCDPSWSSCWGWWGPGFYPANVVVVRAPGFRRFPPGHAKPGLPGHARPGFPGHARPGFPGHAGPVLPGHAGPGLPGNAGPGLPSHAGPGLPGYRPVVGPFGLRGR
jgi:hypothetical protein